MHTIKIWWIICTEKPLWTYLLLAHHPLPNKNPLRNLQLVFSYCIFILISILIFLSSLIAASVSKMHQFKTLRHQIHITGNPNTNQSLKVNSYKQKYLSPRLDPLYFRSIKKLLSLHNDINYTVNGNTAARSNGGLFGKTVLGSKCN